MENQTDEVRLYAATQTLADLVESLELRFPWLGTDDDAGSGADIINTLSEWHAEVKVQAVDDALTVAREAQAAYYEALVAIEAITGEIDDLGDALESEPQSLIDLGERGSIPLPLLAFQACAAVGVASAVWSVVQWAQGVLGGSL